jgi:hypothetical protein
MENRQVIFLELIKETIWWLISALIVAAVLFPIFSKVHYQMLWINGLILFVAVTYFRYAVMLRSVYVLRSKWVRFALSVININFFVFVLRQQQNFLTVYNSYTVEELGKPIKTLSLDEVYNLFSYYFSEVTFSVVACLCLTVALTIRMVLSYWQSGKLRLNAGNEG